MIFSSPDIGIRMGPSGYISNMQWTDISIFFLFLTEEAIVSLDEEGILTSSESPISVGIWFDKVSISVLPLSRDFLPANRNLDF